MNKLGKVIISAIILFVFVILKQEVFTGPEGVVINTIMYVILFLVFRAMWWKKED